MFTSKCQHGQYRTLIVEYYPYRHLLKSLYYIISDRRISPNHVHNLRYRQPVPYLPVNAAWTIPHSKSAVFPMPAFTKSTSFQTLKTFQTMYITKQVLWHSFLIGMCIGIKIYIISPLFTSNCWNG